MTKAEEVAYLQGVAQRNREILGTLLRELPDNERTAESWRIERMDAIAALRSICGEFGDNDWSDDLYLADVVNKHLGDYLYAK